MRLKSALQDLRETTLAAVSGLLAKLSYLASLRRAEGHYEHWGMESVYGSDSSTRALAAAHAEVVAGILRTPIPALLQDVNVSTEGTGLTPQAYVDALHSRYQQLLPAGRTGTPAAAHLNSVLLALSNLERNREGATHSTS